MVRSTLALLAVVPSAFALAYPAGNPIDSLRHIVKRQTLGSDQTAQVEGLLTLAQSVLADLGTGNATAACTTWAGSLTQCQSSSGSSQVQLAVCTCQSDVLDQLNSCAGAYGSTGTDAASGFESFCTNTLPSIAQTSSTGSVVASASSAVSSAVASASSAVSSAVASATSALASDASSISSAVSSATSAASSAASPVASSATSSPASSASGSAPSSSASGTSGVGKVGASVGVTGLVAAGLAALFF
ncbi:hypothetical protein JCM10212_006477 [Sporobolomyces blumeae]